MALAKPKVSSGGTVTTSNTVPVADTTFAAATPTNTSTPQDAPATTSLKSSTVPEGVHAFSWYETPVASETDAVMFRAGVGAGLAMPMLYRGSIVGIEVSGTAAKAGGTATFNVRKNGTKITGAQIVWDNVQRDVERFAKGTYGFARDDYLDVVFTTSSGYTPTTTVVEVTIWVTNDPEETI